MQIYEQEQTYIKHRCKADITATILEAAAAGGTTEKGMYTLQAYNGIRELIDYS